MELHWNSGQSEKFIADSPRVSCGRSALDWKSWLETLKKYVWQLDGEADGPPGKRGQSAMEKSSVSPTPVHRSIWMACDAGADGPPVVREWSA